jgi:phosphatidylserine decarboxylase
MHYEDIKFYNRYTSQLEQELVYGGKFIQALYQNKIGRFFEWFLSTTPYPSKLVGEYYQSSYSQKDIASFIEKYKIETNQFKKGNKKGVNFSDTFNSFDDFFIREFKEGERPFAAESKTMPAFAEARYFATESLHDVIKFPVKGNFLKLHDLLPIPEADLFLRGPMFVARLCPVDYHRYHYPDSGKTLKSYRRTGALHSVSPIALRYLPKVFLRNERRISILETKNFGRLAYIEVGALFVGAIDQTANEKNEFQRGQQKGQFHFGASTVILLGEKDRWTPSEDILDHSYNGIETFVKLGDAVARA